MHLSRIMWPVTGIQHVLVLFTSCVILCGSTQLNRTEQGDDMSSEKRLIRMLLQRYNRVGKQGRPVHDITTPTPVKFGLGLIQMDLDEKKKILALSAWTRYVWRDEYMTWNSSDYANITQIRLDPGLLWIPDIMLYNTPMEAGTIKDADVDIANRHAMAVIDHRGKVSWYPHTIFHVSCAVEVTDFPFDHQMCSTWFGSWTYSSRDMELDMAFPGGIDMASFQQNYKESCAWDIYNVTSERRFLPDESADPAFIVLAFDMQMRRKMVFSSYILTLPCIFLACLTLVVFCLPPERPDRTSLSMSIFSSFLVLLLILVEAAPPTASSIPILGIYYCFNMVIIMASVILSSLVVSVSRGFSGQQAVSKYLDLLVGRVLGTLVLVHKRRPKPPMVKRPNSLIGSDTSQESMRMLNGRYGLDTCTQLQTGRFVYGNDVTDGGVAKLETRVRKLAKHIQETDEAMLSAPEKAFITQQWKYLAIVLDRFFFTVYFILIGLSLALLFPWPT